MTKLMQKTVVFIKHDIRRDNLSDNLKAWFKFSVIDSSLIGTPREHSSKHTAEITITDYLMDFWNLAGVNEPDVVSEDMIKVAFQVAEDHIAELLQHDATLEEKLPPAFLSTENTAKSCPYELSNVSYPANFKFIVEIKENHHHSLRKCLDDFSFYIQSEMRMRFWQYNKKEKKYKWKTQPEQLAKDFLRTFLNSRFKDRLYTFEEIRAGAGFIDIFVISPIGENAIIELKMCGHNYSQNWARSGIGQLVHYMKNKKSELGYLMVFDSRIRDFSQGFLPVEVVDEVSIQIIVTDLRPNVT